MATIAKRLRSKGLAGPDVSEQLQPPPSKQPRITKRTKDEKGFCSELETIKDKASETRPEGKHPNIKHWDGKPVSRITSEFKEDLKSMRGVKMYIIDKEVLVVYCQPDFYSEKLFNKLHKKFPSIRMSVIAQDVQSEPLIAPAWKCEKEIETNGYGAVGLPVIVKLKGQAKLIPAVLGCFHVIKQLIGLQDVDIVFNEVLPTTRFVASYGEDCRVTLGNNVKGVYRQSQGIDVSLILLDSPDVSLAVSNPYFQRIMERTEVEQWTIGKEVMKQGPTTGKTRGLVCGEGVDPPGIIVKPHYDTTTFADPGDSSSVVFLRPESECDNTRKLLGAVTERYKLPGVVTVFPYHLQIQALQDEFKDIMSIVPSNVNFTTKFLPCF